MSELANGAGMVIEWRGEGGGGDGVSERIGAVSENWIVDIHTRNVG